MIFKARGGAIAAPFLYNKTPKQALYTSKDMKKPRLEGKENLVYVAFWGILFLIPVLTLYVRSTFDAHVEFHWKDFIMIWKVFVLYLILFVIHNLFVAPMLVYKRKMWPYIGLVACLLAVFVAIQSTQRPRDGYPQNIKQRQEMRQGVPPPAPRPHDGDGQRAPSEKWKGADRRPPEFGRPPEKPADIFGKIDFLGAIMLLGLLGMNIGVKLYFKSSRDRNRLKELEKESLEQQLEYLKYQINPHFFMNTLNNIHALVDIDKEEAKHAIIELSRMMRYVLYESNKPMVTIRQEDEFMSSYISLMKLRLNDKVRVSVDVQVSDYNQMVAPLIFIAFVENAFKHGISYDEDSFIDIKVRTDGGRLYFNSTNSKHQGSTEHKGGVGLKNIQKRLGLIYGDNYKLCIDDGEHVYSVSLRIPLTTSSTDRS